MRRAFTLVELLVALAVLSLLVLILVQVVSLTGQAININSKNLDAAAQARLVLDRIGSDLAARPDRTDLGMVLTKVNPGNDCLRFYSQVAGYTGARGTTAVGYWIPTAATSTGRPAYQLERGAVGTDFSTGTALQFLPQVLTEADVTAADNPIEEYEVLANGVFRLEFCYLLTTGKLKMNNPNSSPTDYTGVAAIVVALGVLDSKSLLLLPSPSTQMAMLSTALPKITGDDQDPLALWNAKLDPGLDVTGVPKLVLQNIRVYERAFYLQ